MTRTRRSLFFLATYATLSGLVLLAAPGLAFRLMFSNGTYDDVFPRLAGLAILGIGLIVVQIIRHRVEALYLSTLMVRSVLWLGVAWILARTHDPFFALFLGVITLGMLFTGASYLLDRGEQSRRLASSR